MTRLLRPGDVLVLALGTFGVGLLATRALHADLGDTAVIRAGGAVVDTLPLARDRELAVAGPLGQTRIEIRDGRVRVAADPSPRQLCVHQGWLSRSGEAALCLPNQVSVEIPGRHHDTLVY